MSHKNDQFSLSIKCTLKDIFKRVVAVWLRCLALIPGTVDSTPLSYGQTMIPHMTQVLVGSRKRGLSMLQELVSQSS